MQGRHRFLPKARHRNPREASVPACRLRVRELSIRLKALERLLCDSRSAAISRLARGDARGDARGRTAGAPPNHKIPDRAGSSQGSGC